MKKHRERRSLQCVCRKQLHVCAIHIYRDMQNMQDS